jgi:autoinducer 2-degrading protein
VLIHTAHLVCRLEAVDAFQAALARHARTSLEREPGCLRFDVYREKTDATLFFLSEVYADQAALDAHRQTEHFLTFRLQTADWITSRTWWFWYPVTPHAAT